MQIHGTRLPPTQRFLCSRQTINNLFGQDLAWAGFAYPTPRFRPTLRGGSRLRLDGPVVAKLTVPPSNPAYLCLYPLAQAEATPEAVAAFQAAVLPRFRAWLTAKLSRPATEVFGCEEIIAEWIDGHYRFHLVP
jgi:hypothetical protein